MSEIDYSNFVIAAYLVSAVLLSGLFLSVVRKYILLKNKLKNAQ